MTSEVRHVHMASVQEHLRIAARHADLVLDDVLTNEDDLANMSVAGESWANAVDHIAEALVLTQEALAGHQGVGGDA